MVRPSAPRARSLAALLALATVVACSGENTGIRRFPLEPSASPGVLTITPPRVTLDFIGDAQRLSASVQTADGAPVSGLQGTFTSLEPAVATVASDGTVTAVQEGQTRIVATLFNLADTVSVTVKRVPATIVVAPDTLLFTELQARAALGVTVLDGAGQALPDPVTWSSSDDSVVSVAQDGSIQTLAQGRVTITARAGGAAASARVQVSVGPSIVDTDTESIVFSALGDSTQVRAEVLDARGDVLEGVPIRFLWVDTLIADVSETGWVRARGLGSTSVIVEADTVRASVSVSVRQDPDSVAVSPRSVSMVVGATQAFTSEVFDRNRNPIVESGLFWQSSDPDIVFVDANGVATAVAVGEVLVSGIAGEASDSARVNVVDLQIDSLVLDADSIALDPSTTRQLAARFFDQNGVEIIGPKATWSSAADSVATVTATGLVRGVAQGTTWVFAMADSAQDSVHVTVNAPPSAFNIEVRFVGGAPDASVQAAFDSAERRWESILVGDLPDAAANIPAAACGIGHPAVSETVDDVVIFSEVAAIDGPGGILGQAGPCLVRTAEGLAVVGTMQFDDADLDVLAAGGDLEGTILHEMGHVLGFGVGTPWSDVLVGAGSADPYWPGTEAVAQFDSAGGIATNKVPVANTGSSGTRDAHWREVTMGRELMTGFLDSGVLNALSAISIGAMKDMGYTVDLTQGDPYTVSGALRAPGPRARLLHDRVLPPRFTVDRNGRVRAVGR